MRLLDWFRSFRRRDSDMAMAELRHQLRAKGFDINHEPDRSLECEGLQVCILLADSRPTAGLTEKEIEEKWREQLLCIYDTTLAVSKKHWLFPAGLGKANREDGSIIFHCGFRNPNIFNG